MRIIGIDPGIAIVGFGIIDVKIIRQQRLAMVRLRPPTMSVGQRLKTIKDNLTTVLNEHQPDQCGIETLFFSRNVKT